MRIGTRTLGRAEAGADAAVAGPPGGGKSAQRGEGGADGTLLAVVPIPGTGTSLAIVGYPVAMPGEGITAGAVPASAVPAAAAVPALSAIAAGVPVDATRTGLLLDPDQRRVWADGREITLTFQEFELLAFLAAHPATVFTRADLVRQVWQRDFAADSRTVDVHVSRLRHKLGPYGRSLVTEYRVGYQYRP